MVRAPGIAVPPSEAEATRRRLQDLGVLRHDLKAAHEGGSVVFPVVDSCGPRLPTREADFEPRGKRPGRYQDLLGWSDDEKARAPRAFEHLGDIVVVKVPEGLAARRDAVGDALLRFHRNVRAVFHDEGVHGVFRTRRLLRIAGTGEPRTLVSENGVRLAVDLTRAYFSPRLADERARVVLQVRPGDHVIDLFGGVAPLGVQAAKAGAIVDSVDLNPDAVALAGENVAQNRVGDRVRLHLGDAREVAARLEPGDHVIMNLPHAAKAFLDVAVPLVRPGGVLHYHEIIEDGRIDARRTSLEHEVRALGREAAVRAVRHVRAYATGVSHYAFDIEVGEGRT